MNSSGLVLCIIGLTLFLLWDSNSSVAVVRTCVIISVLDVSFLVMVSCVTHHFSSDWLLVELESYQLVDANFFVESFARQAIAERY